MSEFAAPYTGFRNPEISFGLPTASMTSADVENGENVEKSATLPPPNGIRPRS